MVGVALVPLNVTVLVPFVAPKLVPAMVTDVPAISVRTTAAEAVRMMKANFGDESFMNAAPGLIVLNERGGLAGILTHPPGGPRRHRL